MSKINVLGWYNHFNAGDESYKISFPKLFPSHEFDFTQPSSCDTCILGGGDILNRQFVHKLLDSKAKQRIAMSVSVSAAAPFELLKKLDGIYVRDVRSVRLLQTNDVRCTYMPDVSTGLEPNRAAGEMWLKKQYADNGLELYNKRVGIVLNSHLNQGPDALARDHLNLLKVSWDLGKMMDETPASFILFPMSTGMPWDDRVTNGWLAGRCKFWRKNFVVYDRLSVQTTLDLIASCDVIISSRLHSSIFSMVSEVPFIDLTHHDKNRGFLETAGLEDWSLSYWHLEFDELKRKLQDMLGNDTYRSKLKDIKLQQIQALQKEASNVCFL